MNLFLDTEFADMAGTDLISLGLVSEDGALEFYAEVQELPATATDFVKAYVYPKTQRGKFALPDWEFTSQLRTFLETIDSPHIIFDMPYDWRLFCWVANGFDLGRFKKLVLPPLPDVEATLDQRDELRKGIDAWFTCNPEAPRHHALTDARVLRDVWMALRAKS